MLNCSIKLLQGGEKMLKLNSFNSLVTTKKFKKAKKNKVYDKEWNMLFVNEKARLDFRKAISNAEEDIKNKKEGTWEELITEFEQEYGIQLQH